MCLLLGLDRDSNDMSRVFGFGCEHGFDYIFCFGWIAIAMTCPGFLVLAVGLVLTVALALAGTRSDDMSQAVALAVGLVLTGLRWNAEAITCPGFLVFAVGLVLTVARALAGTRKR